MHSYTEKVLLYYIYILNFIILMNQMLKLKVPTNVGLIVFNQKKKTKIH